MSEVEEGIDLRKAIDNNREQMGHRIIIPHNPSTTHGNMVAIWSTRATTDRITGIMGDTVTSSISSIGNRSNDPAEIIIPAASTSELPCAGTAPSPDVLKDPVANATIPSTLPNQKCHLKPVLNFTLTPHSTRHLSVEPHRISR